MGHQDLQQLFSKQIIKSEKERGKNDYALIGVVTDNKDPSKLGRVKVKIPTVSANDTTWWSPIIMLGAGKNRGWFFIPEIDDEVLVIFEQGDLQRPIIVGALWNGKDKPSDKNPGGVPRRSIKSRGGSLIVFDDEKGKIEISDGAKKSKITFDSAANKITIESLEGDVCFQAPKGDILINAKSIEMTTKSGNIEAVAGKNMTWSTDDAMTLKGGSSMTWSGSTNNENCGNAQPATVPDSSPQDVNDPYGS